MEFKKQMMQNLRIYKLEIIHLMRIAQEQQKINK